jgi:7,8-dihydropterin-6-yl-methyl-4-(beta-D-ribofuranosyl)aminobenzene 5'-phosphate synthase
MVSNQRITKSPIAEHGFSVILEITYFYGNTIKTNKFLFDAGVSKDGIIYNSTVLGINLTDIETIILSHGHFDPYFRTNQYFGKNKKVN